MSWDIFVQDFPMEAKTIDEIPDDFSSKPIGGRDEIIAKIKEIIPTANFSDKAWGIIETPDFSIEVNLGKEEILTGLAFHIHGGNEAAACIVDILRHLNLRAVDSGSGDFFDMNQPAEGLQKWRAYRDQILAEKHQ